MKTYNTYEVGVAQSLNLNQRLNDNKKLPRITNFTKTEIKSNHYLPRMLNEVQTAKTHIKGQIVSISSQSLEKDDFTKSPKSPISFGSTGRKQLENDTSIEEDTRLINNLQDALKFMKCD